MLSPISSNCFAACFCVQVYVEVKVTEPADYFLLRLNECWATQFPQPNATAGLVYTLLLNGSAELSVHCSRTLSRHGLPTIVKPISSPTRFSSHYAGAWMTRPSPF